jgi:hypothetical protein
MHLASPAALCRVHSVAIVFLWKISAAPCPAVLTLWQGRLCLCVCGRAVEQHLARGATGRLVHTTARWCAWRVPCSVAWRCLEITVLHAAWLCALADSFFSLCMTLRVEGRERGGVRGAGWGTGGVRCTRGRRGGVCPVDLHHQSGGVYIQYDRSSHMLTSHVSVRGVPSLWLEFQQHSACVSVWGVRACLSHVPCVLSAGWSVRGRHMWVPSVQQCLMCTAVTLFVVYMQALLHAGDHARWWGVVLSVYLVRESKRLCAGGGLSTWCPVLRRLQPDFAQCRVGWFFGVVQTAGDGQQGALVRDTEKTVVGDRWCGLNDMRSLMPVVTCSCVNE